MELSGEKQQISVLIAEDHEITLMGLRLSLERDSRIKLVGSAADGAKAVELAGSLCPDVILMDIGLPVLDGVAATHEIKRTIPAVRVIMLTSHDSDEDVFAALRAGADGYCLKTVGVSQLVTAISCVASGAAWLDPAIAARVLRRAGCVPQSSSEPAGRSGALSLSARELEVLWLIVDGLSNQQIAERLVVSIETVKSHVRHILEKLVVNDRTQAAVKAIRDGLVPRKLSA